MKVVQVIWNAPENVFHEILWKKSFIVNPCLKIIKLIESEDGEIRAATFLLPTRNTVNRPINCLYPLETAAVSDELNSDPLPQEQIQQKENGVNVKQLTERSKRQAARIARDKLKEMLSEEIGTFVCCKECLDDHNL